MEIVFSRSVLAGSVLWATVSHAIGQSAVGTGRIGSAIDIRGTVESNVQSRTYPLNKGGVVYRNQWVNTREKSVAGLGFHDQTKMHIGPKSSVKLNPTLKPGVVSLSVGAPTEYRMKNSSADTATYKIRDQNGTLTVSPDMR